MDPVYGPERQRRALVLCFDGTGNKFSGTNSDSNIIKIYSLLDRQSPLVHSYYQPGIGTYIEDSALSKTSRLAKVRSAYMKAKDSAVGTSFDQHVMSAYQFLMQHYGHDEDLYFFGFSRGAYIARFLAQMLDSVGLLSRGNEEMMRFAWKAFAQWQTRMGETEAQRKKKRENFEFMRAFRETFSRPVRRIRFLGLFDTVNSVPRFETAWMSRSKFPYSCKSSAKIVRHAVSIDENRAKFRQNLISQKRPSGGNHPDPHANGAHTNGDEKPRLNHRNTMDARFTPQARNRKSLAVPAQPSKDVSRRGSVSSLNSQTAGFERAKTHEEDEEDDDEAGEQDIQEIWFPGAHADIGGGWPVEPGLEAGLSHTPLLWMVREARKAGVPFEPNALEKTGYLLEDDLPDGTFEDLTEPPQIQIEGRPMPAGRISDPERHSALEILNKAATRGMIHHSLKFGCGTPPGGVIAWKCMEYLPIRRMDLRPDGTWAPIRWPLPCGEPRDIPEDAWIHYTAILRMDADPNYRPGNLIVGGGGRGMKVAPKSAGKGKWNKYREIGSPIGECYVRATKGGTKVFD